jgi:hypothetical protein
VQREQRRRGHARASRGGRRARIIRRRFYSPELDATYDLAASDHRLVLRRPRAAADTLRALDDHTFRGTGVTIRFAAPGAFTVDNGRARGLEFNRVN